MKKVIFFSVVAWFIYDNHKEFLAKPRTEIRVYGHPNTNQKEALKSQYKDRTVVFDAWQPSFDGLPATNECIYFTEDTFGLYKKNPNIRLTIINQKFGAKQLNSNTFLTVLP